MGYITDLPQCHLSPAAVPAPASLHTHRSLISLLALAVPVCSSTPSLPLPYCTLNVRWIDFILESQSSQKAPGSRPRRRLFYSAGTSQLFAFSICQYTLLYPSPRDPNPNQPSRGPIQHSRFPTSPNPFQYLANRKRPQETTACIRLLHVFTVRRRLSS